MKKFTKYLLILVLSVILAACATNKQKRDASNLSKKVEAFRTTNNTSIEFLAFMNLSKDYSYVVDSPLLVEMIIQPNIAIVNFNGNSFAVEFTDKELAQSFPQLKIGANILFQEGILLDNGNFKDADSGKTYKKFKLCRSEECRNLATASIAYIYRWTGVDATIPSSYQVGDLHKFLVDSNLLEPATK
ncbi:MAG: hypothetical protein LBQ34_07245 [Alphaproteobacteria bacterium]|jgi:hypothetical protein|nr:hypothetical protein [Alphaproteobacteria bacterium]